MPITFMCPNCRGSLTRPDSDAGTKIFCPSCNQKLRVPVPPRPTDKTMLGELQGPDNRTLLAEIVSSAPTIASPLRCICPQCQVVIAAHPNSAGERIACPGCGCSVELPLLKAELVQEGSRPPAVSSAENAARPELSFDDAEESNTARPRVRAHRGTTLLVLGILSIVTGLLIPL